MLYSFASCKFNTSFWVFSKSIPSRQIIHSSAVITDLCSTSESLGCNCTNSVTLPMILTIELLAVSSRFVYVCTIPGLPSFLHVNQLKSDILIPLSISPTHLFPWSIISSFRHLIVFDERILMTSRSRWFFLWNGSFFSTVGNCPHRKKFRQFLEVCSSWPQALHLKPCLPFLLIGLSLLKDLSRWLANRRRLLKPRSCCCLLSRLLSPHRPQELLRSLDCFRRISRCLSTTDNWLTSLVTATTKSFVSSRLWTATFGWCVLFLFYSCYGLQMQCSFQNSFNFHIFVADLLYEI